MYSSNKQRMQHILNKDLTLTPPPPPPKKKKKIKNIFLNFSWDDCNTQKKSKTKVIQKFGGKLGVLWEISANGEWNYFPTIC